MVDLEDIHSLEKTEVVVLDIAPVEHGCVELAVYTPYGFRRYMLTREDAGFIISYLDRGFKEKKFVCVYTEESDILVSGIYRQVLLLDAERLRGHEDQSPQDMNCQHHGKDHWQDCAIGRVRGLYNICFKRE